MAASLDTKRRNAILVELQGTKVGLGIKIVGGHNHQNPQQAYGIYIKDIIREHLAHRNGKLRIGDQLLQANGQSLVGVSNEDAVDILRSCAATDKINLYVARDSIAKDEYGRLSSGRESGGDSNGRESQEDTPPDDDVTPQDDTESLDHVSYTSDSSEDDPQRIKMEQVKFSLRERPLSAISDVSGPPPPLPTSPPPDVDDDESAITSSSPLSHEPTEAETSLSMAGSEVAAIAARRRALQKHHEEEKASLPTTSSIPLAVIPEITAVTTEKVQPILWTEKVTSSPSDGTPTRTLFNLPSDAPSAYFKHTGSGPKIEDKRQTPQDITKLAQPRADELESGTKKQTQKVSASDHKRFSVDPLRKFTLKKLILALSYIIGYNVTPEQEEHIRQSLTIDSDDKVVYDEFAEVVKRIYKIKLDSEQFVEALQRKLSIPTFTPPPEPTTTISREDSSEDGFSLHGIHQLQRKDIPTGIPTATYNPMQQNAIEQLRIAIAQRDEALKDAEYYKRRVLEEKKENEAARAELLKAANSKAGPTDRDMERLRDQLSDKEKEVKSLVEKINEQEKEIIKVKKEAKEKLRNTTTSDISTRLAVKDCELKKKDDALRRYKVATEQLCQFIEKCQEVLTHSDTTQVVYHPQGRGESVTRGNQVTGNPRPPPYLSKHSRKTANSLADEAKEVLLAARKIMSQGELPEGWAVAYNEEGEKYYINHKDQKTSWDHPETRLATNEDKEGHTKTKPYS